MKQRAVSELCGASCLIARLGDVVPVSPRPLVVGVARQAMPLKHLKHLGPRMTPSPPSGTTVHVAVPVLSLKA